MGLASSAFFFFFCLEYFGFAEFCARAAHTKRNSISSMSTKRLFTQGDIDELDLLNNDVVPHKRAAKLCKYLLEHAEPESERDFFNDDDLETTEEILGMAVDRELTLESVAAAIDQGVGKKKLARELRNRANER